MESNVCNQSQALHLSPVNPEGFGPPRRFWGPLSSISASTEWKADPASQGISPTSCPSNVPVSCHLKAATNSSEAATGRGASCPGWRRAGRLLLSLQPPLAPSATPAGHTAAREVTKQHLSCPVLQVCPSEWDRSFCRVSRGCSEFVHPLRAWRAQAGPGFCAVPRRGSPRSGDTGSPIPYGSSLPAQTAEDCLMLWKLTRVGEVGMDMARATRARMECLSCHRCHRFRTAERTWGCETGDVQSPRGHSEAPATRVLSLPTQKCYKKARLQAELVFACKERCRHT